MRTVLISTLVCLAVTPLLVHWLPTLGMVDVPNARSSHAAPVPRGGGVAVAVATIVGVVAWNEWSDATIGLVIGALVLGIVGLIDDRKGLSPSLRLSVQLATPLVIGLALIHEWRLGTMTLTLLGVFAVAGYVNAFNFMDGINGISASQAAIAGAFLAILTDQSNIHELTVAGWAVCGASLGFLPFNLVRARVFLGDVGSYFLGAWLAGLAVLAVASGAPPIVTIAPFLLYLADTSVTVLRRFRRGERLTVAHKDHCYQRLTQCGMSHVTVSSICGATSLACSAIMLAVLDQRAVIKLAGVFVALAFVTGYMCLPSLVERRRTLATWQS